MASDQGEPCYTAGVAGVAEGPKRASDQGERCYTATYQGQRAKARCLGSLVYARARKSTRTPRAGFFQASALALGRKPVTGPCSDVG